MGYYTDTKAHTSGKCEICQAYVTSAATRLLLMRSPELCSVVRILEIALCNVGLGSYGDFLAMEKY